MSLIFQDPKKYMELMAKYAEEEKEILEESVAKIKEAPDEEYVAGLKWIGLLLTNIRIGKGYTLRSFVIEKFNGEAVSASRISNIERGLDIPTPDIIKKYVDLFEEKKDD